MQLLYTQGNDTLLVQADHPDYETARPTLSFFADLSQSMDPIHVYKIRPTTLWQSASLGLYARSILKFLRHYSENPIPYQMQRTIVDTMARFGKLWLHKVSDSRIILRGEAQNLQSVEQFQDVLQLSCDARADGIVFPMSVRAEVKRRLLKHGYPVLDRVGYQNALHVEMHIQNHVQLRPYQIDAVSSFFGSEQNQSGVIVLPCGAGKTVVGIGVMLRLQLHTLIVTPNETSARQWMNELFDKTTLNGESVTLYGDPASLSPVTITTYQRVTAKSRNGQFRHLEALTTHAWGLVIYDEVHMLPAPLFRLAADLQGARRLGLTATLVREDGAEDEVYSLIGSKCFELPWKQLEAQGYLSPVKCCELRVPLPEQVRHTYENASPKQQHKIAAGNPEKIKIVESLCERHRGENVLVMGHYLEMLEHLAAALGCPFLSGQTPQEERIRVLEQFRTGQIKCLVLSRIANMAIDLPSASVAIQVSGLFGSRQEEAQRLGRLLRPGTASGVFYTLVSAHTVEERMAKHRQTYLVEQGYAYDIVNSVDFVQEGIDSSETVRMCEHG